MADIKTKDNAKGTIRTIDKAAVATQRMKQAYIATKEKAEPVSYTHLDVYKRQLCKGNPDPYYRLREHSYQTGHTWHFRYAPNLKGGANR